MTVKLNVTTTCCSWKSDKRGRGRKKQQTNMCSAGFPDSKTNGVSHGRITLRMVYTAGTPTLNWSLLHARVWIMYRAEGQGQNISFCIWYEIYIFNRSWVDTRWQQYITHWVDTRWQQYITHWHTNSTQNTDKGKLGSAGRAPSLRIIPWHLPYNWGKTTINLG
jgi:hypothetical protein